MLCDKVIAKEMRHASLSVGNQRFLLGEFELESLTQELADLALNLLCFDLWSAEAEQIPVGDGACRRFPGSAGPASAGPNPAYSWVGRQRVTRVGTFPTAPRRTTRDRFPYHVALQWPVSCVLVRRSGRNGSRCGISGTPLAFCG